MNICPNCGNNVSGNEAVCECGQMLWGEVTNHSNAWETETVFRPGPEAKKKILLPAAVLTISVVLIAILAWPRLSADRSSEETINNASTDQITQTTGTTSSSDLVRNENIDSPVAQAGVFDFSTGERQAVRARILIRPTNEAGETTVKETVPANLPDAQVASSKSPDTSKLANQTSSSDCKPEKTTSLKLPEPRPADSDSKPQPKQTGINYILGPRGGCFFVTAGGGKKYVDHSLCSSSTAAAARQD